MGKSPEAQRQATPTSEGYEGRKNLMPCASFLSALCVKWKVHGL